MQIVQVIIGILAGILSGMFGIGGGIFIVPVLVTFFDYAFREAVSTSLAALMLPVNIFAVIAYYRAGKLRIGVAALIAVGLIVGGVLGAELSQSLPTQTLQRLYALFLMYTSWRFTEPRKWLAEWRTGATAPEPVPSNTLKVAWYQLLVIGLGAGVISGMFGVGGGIVIVPMLVTVLHFDQKLAVGTSLTAMLLPVTAGSVFSYYQEGILRVEVAAFVALGLLFGSLAGAKIALSLPERTIKRLYGIFLFFVALRFLLQP